MSYTEMTAATNQDAINSNEIPKKANFSVNRYATQKTIAAGTMNIALLTSNANHLKVLFNKDEKDHNGYYYFVIVLICLSMLLQVVMAVLAMMVGGSNVCLESTDNDQDEAKRKIQNKNSVTTILAVLATLINILASTFYGD